MKDSMSKLMAKHSDKKPLDPNYKSAKMSMLKALHDEMSNMMKGDLDGVKKVEVASNSPEGLKAGLEKAHNMVDSKSNESDVSEDMDGIANHESNPDFQGHEDADNEDMEEDENDEDISKKKDQAIESESEIMQDLENANLSEDDIDHLMAKLQELKMKKSV